MSQPCAGVYSVHVYSGVLRHVHVCSCVFMHIYMSCVHAKGFFLVCEHHLLVSHVLGFFFIKPNFKKTKNNNLFSFSLEFVSCLCKSWRFYAA